MNLNEDKNAPISKTVSAIQVKNFSKKYPRNKNYSVKDMSFEVKQGDFHGFIGANGAGKTTIIKSIIGAYARFEGSVSILGLDNTDKSAKKEIGYIPEVALFPQSFSTKSYLKNMAMLSGMKAKDATKFAMDKLKELKMETIAKRSPNNLSSGQKKKILLAQALLHNPKIVIMDEPAANLDPKARTEFFQYLLRIKKENNVTIFISSHILDELEKYVDSITIIDNGKKAFSGNLQEALNSLSRDGNPTWSIVTNDIKKTSELLTKEKIEFTLSTNKFSVSISERDIVTLYGKFVTNKIEVYKLIRLGSDLESIYEQYAIDGSMDVMSGGDK